MADITKTMKLHIHASDEEQQLFAVLAYQYSNACNFVSQHVFDNGFVLNFMKLQQVLYDDIRTQSFLIT